MADHRVLNGVQIAIRTAQAFNRPDRLAVHLTHQQDTGIDRAPAVRIRQDDRAGPAIALVTALFGAGQVVFVAQKVQQGARGLIPGNARHVSIQKKRNIHAMSPPLSLPQGLRRQCPMRRKAMARPLYRDPEKPRFDQMARI